MIDFLDYFPVVETRFQIVGPPIPDVCTDCIILGKLDSFLLLIYLWAVVIVKNFRENLSNTTQNAGKVALNEFRLCFT